MTKRNYSNGYLGKIQYWTQRVVNATESGNVQEQLKALESLAYFVQKQKKRTVTQGAMSSVFKETKSVFQKDVINGVTIFSK